MIAVTAYPCVLDVTQTYIALAIAHLHKLLSSQRALAEMLEAKIESSHLMTSEIQSHLSSEKRRTH